MKFLIPTAKEMASNLTPVTPTPLSSNSLAIVEAITSYEPNDLAKRYKIKTGMAEVEWQRWQAIQQGQAQSFPALDLFNGLMYRQINRQNLSDADMNYLSQHLFITSALYGIIPATYPIAPHRLDFHTKLKIEDKSLKQIWQEDYDRFLATQTEPVVSLLSSEFEQVFSPNYQEKLIKIAFFEENQDGQLKKHSTISKKARGQFVNVVMKHKPETIDDLKAMAVTDFHYRSDLSKANHLVFVKKI